MFTKISRLLSALLIGGMLLGSVAFPISVRADSIITVTTTDDELNSDGDCSLREAIQAANINDKVDKCVPGSGIDTIKIPAGTYTLTITGANEDANATGDLDITDSVSINGAGASKTVIQADANSTNGIDRVFDVALAITVNISNVKIANGNRMSYGGGILNNGTLTVMDSIFSDNTAYQGGGIYNNKALKVRNSIFSKNFTFDFGPDQDDRGGGIFNNSSLSVKDSTFLGGTSFQGGGIYNVRSATVTNCLFKNNVATNTGGGIENSAYLVVTDSTFSGNTAKSGGGISTGGNLTVLGSTFSGNQATSWGGGGISNLAESVTVVNSTFSSNTAGYGGGIAQDMLGTITVVNSTFSGNSDAVYNNEGFVVITNSILANSWGPDCSNPHGNLGYTISGANNLIETNSDCTTTSPITADPISGHWQITVALPRPLPCSSVPPPWMQVMMQFALPRL